MLDLLAVLHRLFDRHHETRAKEFAELRAFIHQELKTMGTSLSEQLTAAQAETNAQLDAIGTDVTEVAADVDRLLAGMTAGDPVTQAMVDAATAIRDRTSAIKAGLDAVNAKVPPTTPAP